jgi:lipopolysaccharide export system protein LptA
MIKKYIFILSFIPLFAFKVFPQQQGYITVIGDSLVGKMEKGEMIRDVYGHVVLTQGNVRITCQHAVQYISQNNAELIGNVVATQDTLIITTDKGFYYGDQRKAESVSGIKLDDRKVVLTADTGVYFFNDDKAFFNSHVTLKDTSSTLTSRQLTYFKNVGKAIAVGGVKIIEGNNIIHADSLIHFRESRISYAFGNVKINNLDNNSIILGEHLEDYPAKSYSIIDKSPLFFQIDSSYSKTKRNSFEITVNDTSTLRIDTLVISSKFMEAYRDTFNIFIASDSVRIVRGSFASVNDYAKYYKNEGKIISNKVSEDSPQPVMWYENSQLTGDSITVFLKNNSISKLDVERNSFILSQNEKYINRYDQISGTNLKVFFEDGKIIQTNVYGGVHSIYYTYEGDSANGLTKASSENAIIYFEDNKVSTIKLYGTPVSEYYPEKMVMHNERAFTLPGFIIYNNRPTKSELLGNKFILKNKE